TTATAGEKTPVDGSQPPADGGSPPPPPTDVEVAKAFFAGLRSNAAALMTGAADTGITDGVKAFGDSLKAANGLGEYAIEEFRAAHGAYDLWKQYTSGATTSNESQLRDYGGSCVVYQGSFPTQVIAAGTTPGYDYVGPYTPA